MTTFSLVVSHASWRPDRVASWAAMRVALEPLPEHVVVDVGDCRDRWQQVKVAWALSQWRWGITSSASHVVFMTDELNIAPRFWEILTAMVDAKPDAIIGLMSNHPQATPLALTGYQWYRTNAWIVGAAYVVPREALIAFVEWYEAMDPETCRTFNEDSALNEWITRKGPGEAWHPLPAPIEHRRDIRSTHEAHVGGADDYAYERISWRQTQDPWVRYHYGETHKAWHAEPREWSIVSMCDRDYWAGAGPMLRLP